MVERAGDAVVFLALLLVSWIVVAAVIIATPVVLVASAIAGLVASGKSQSNWRPVGA